MKRTLIGAAVAAAAILAVPAAAQMMGGYGYGGYGPGYGMMGGYGPGYGMMGGYGPGYMHGYGGYGPRGYGRGGYGYGPGMMWGDDGGYAGVNLSAEQRKQIAQIQDELAQTQWKLMDTMHQQRYHMFDFFGPGPLDEQAARQSFQAMTGARQAMFEASLDARKRIDAVLTKAQREQLQKGRP